MLQRSLVRLPRAILVFCCEPRSPKRVLAAFERRVRGSMATHQRAFRHRSPSFDGARTAGFRDGITPHEAANPLFAWFRLGS
jgi:hypothetical protein